MNSSSLLLPVSIRVMDQAYHSSCPYRPQDSMMDALHGGIRVTEQIVKRLVFDYNYLEAVNTYFKSKNIKLFKLQKRVNKRTSDRGSIGKVGQMTESDVKAIIKSYQELILAAKIPEGKIALCKKLFEHWIDILHIMWPHNLEYNQNRVLQLQVDFFMTYTDLFGKHAVTPYVHLIACHLDYFINLSPLKSIGIWANQGFEAIHQDCRLVFTRSTIGRGGVQEEGKHKNSLQVMSTYYRTYVVYNKKPMSLPASLLQRFLKISNPLVSRKFLWTHHHNSQNNTDENESLVDTEDSLSPNHTASESPTQTLMTPPQISSTSSQIILSPLIVSLPSPQISLQSSSQFLSSDSFADLYNSIAKRNYNMTGSKRQKISHTLVSNTQE